MSFVSFLRNRHRQRGDPRHSRNWRRPSRSVEQWPVPSGGGDFNDDDDDNNDDDGDDLDNDDDVETRDRDKCNCTFDVTISMLTLDTSVHGYKVSGMVLVQYTLRCYCLPFYEILLGVCSCILR